MTSHLFDSETAEFRPERLQRLVDVIGADRLVIDLSCRRDALEGREGPEWIVAMNRWQTPTDLRGDGEGLWIGWPIRCAEFLIHAADVEGRCEGNRCGTGGNARIVRAGGRLPMPVERVRCRTFRRWMISVVVRVDLTIGSALDIFGGSLVNYADCVKFNRRESSSTLPQTDKA